jgi:hypothetical protein
MDHTTYSNDPEVDRMVNNELAWKNHRGYRTSSGCPCWDRSKHPCIPKHTGWGYNVNFWALFCCCLCQDVQEKTIPANFQSHRLSTRHDPSVVASTKTSGQPENENAPLATNETH